MYYDVYCSNMPYLFGNMGKQICNWLRSKIIDVSDN